MLGCLKCVMLGPEPKPKPEPEMMLPRSRWAVDPTGEHLLPVNELVLEFPGAEAAPVQIASDLHLEFIREGCGCELDMDDLLVPSAPILVLLGDIGIPTHALYREFLLLQAGRFEAVLVLTGNHEFYDAGQQAAHPREGQTSHGAAMEWGMRPRNSTHDMELKIQEICDEHERLHYVDNRVVRLGPGATAPALICTPLWSHVPAAAMDQVGRALNDYRLTYVETDVAEPAAAGKAAVRNARGLPLRRLAVGDTSRWHGLATNFIRRELHRLCAAGVTAVSVFTHHTPNMQGTSHPRHEGGNENAIQHAFSTDLTDIYSASPQLVLW
eukprot:CAMPEP_0181300208 /NCGR_PEP_ID=MMETSP1101-20121128/6766_1 /TAXON_ID=46948 /ORGANISM="Rhodomonas abbreviata, Strain Caron Lab Isolate" /LENGTH=325 /DNA_ID=CAMNT_0023405427 /DNA_START=61 /DNA_END=1035 /DNA_ORIENTATION=+